MSKEISRTKNKTILIQLDILNTNILKIQKNDKIEKNIEKKDNYLKIILGKEILFKENKKITIEEFEKELETLKEQYENIIINTPMECFFEYTQKILNKSDKIIFLIENTIVDIKKSKNLLKIYLDNWKIDKYKIEIIINETIEELKKKEIKYLNKIIYKTQYEDNKKLLSSHIIPKIKYKKNEYFKIIKNIKEQEK